MSFERQARWFLIPVLLVGLAFSVWSLTARAPGTWIAIDKFEATNGDMIGDVELLLEGRVRLNFDGKWKIDLARQVDEAKFAPMASTGWRDHEFRRDDAQPLPLGSEPWQRLASAPVDHAKTGTYRLCASVIVNAFNVFLISSLTRCDIFLITPATPARSAELRPPTF